MKKVFICLLFMSFLLMPDYAYSVQISNSNNSVNDSIIQRIDCDHSKEYCKSVSDVIEKVMKAYQNEDTDAFLEHVSKHDGVVFLGTTNFDRYIGYERVKKGLKIDFGVLSDVTLTIPWVLINGTDNVAWVSAQYVFKGKMNGNKKAFPARQTFVLIKEAGVWKIIASHFSIVKMIQAPGAETSPDKLKEE